VHEGRHADQQQQRRPDLILDGTIDKSDVTRVDDGNSIMPSGTKSSFQDDNGLGGITMDEFVRERLNASPKPASAENGVSRPATVTKLKHTALVVHPESDLDAFPTVIHYGLWYPPAKYTNRFKRKSTGSSCEKSCATDCYMMSKPAQNRVDEIAGVRKPRECSSAYAEIKFDLLQSTP
jgi:hypothetical protein